MEELAAIVLDVDGTLLTSEHRIGDAAHEAIAVGEGLRREAAITGQRLESLVDEGACAAPHKLLGIADPIHGLGQLHELRHRLPSDCDGRHSHRHYLEITACGVHKAAAVMRICEREAISTEQVAAIGDGENDIALLRLAGIGVAMGQADAQVCAAADWVTDTNDRDGVALAIERLLSGASHTHGRMAVAEG